jgi:hypothetical protein
VNTVGGLLSVALWGSGRAEVVLAGVELAVVGGFRLLGGTG